MPWQSRLKMSQSKVRNLTTSALRDENDICYFSTFSRRIKLNCGERLEWHEHSNPIRHGPFWGHSTSSEKVSHKLAKWSVILSFLFLFIYLSEKLSLSISLLKNMDIHQRILIHHFVKPQRKQFRPCILMRNLSSVRYRFTLEDIYQLDCGSLKLSLVPT